VLLDRFGISGKGSKKVSDGEGEMSIKNIKNIRNIKAGTGNLNEAGSEAKVHASNGDAPSSDTTITNAPTTDATTDTESAENYDMIDEHSKSNCKKPSQTAVSDLRGMLALAGRKPEHFEEHRSQSS